MEGEEPSADSAKRKATFGRKLWAPVILAMSWLLLNFSERIAISMVKEEKNARSCVHGIRI